MCSKAKALQAFLVTSLSATAFASADVELQSALRILYPAVNEWHISETRVTDFRLPFVIVKSLSSGVVVSRRDGYFRVEYAMNGHRLVRTYHVQGRGPVMVATQLIPSGQALTASMLDIQERDIMAAPCASIEEAASMAGLRVKNQIRAGEIVCAQNTEAVPSVTRTMQVVLSCTVGGVTLQTDGRALDDGSVGQRIRVRRENTGRVLFAVVKDKGEVNVCI